MLALLAVNAMADPLNMVLDSMDFAIISPHFEVTNWTAGGPILENFVKTTANEAGSHYYGWVVNEDAEPGSGDVVDNLYCREAYVDGAAVNAHLWNVNALFGQFLNTPAATLERLRLHGTAGQLAVMKPTWDAIGLSAILSYWRNIMGFSVMDKVFDEYTDGTSLKLPYEFATIMPTFTIHDWPVIQTYLQTFVEMTYYNESVPLGSVLYYGWDVLEDENGTVTHLFCREAYKNGAGVVAHLNNVGGLLGEMLGTGAATLTELHFTGPFTDAEKAEVESILGGTQTFYDTSTARTASNIMGFSQQASEAAKVLDTMDFAIISPHFDVTDWVAGGPIMEDFVNATKTEPGSQYCECPANAAHQLMADTHLSL